MNADEKVKLLEKNGWEVSFMSEEGYGDTYDVTVPDNGSFTIYGFEDDASKFKLIQNACYDNDLIEVEVGECNGFRNVLNAIKTAIEPSDE